MTFGSVRLRREGDNQLILIPAPSNDLNDPLNWSKAFRWYIAIIACLAMFLSNFLAAGPSVSIVEVVHDFYGLTPVQPGFSPALSKVSYFFSISSLLQGLSNLFWMPLIIKYGRRPVYLASFLMYLVSAIWAGRAESYASKIVARILLGFASGSGECVGPLTIADIFFLHERGFAVSLYTAALSAGVSVGLIVAGLVSMDHNWRVIYYIGTGLIGALLLVVFFTMPETNFIRDNNTSHSEEEANGEQIEDKSLGEKDGQDILRVEAMDIAPPKKPYLETLRVWNPPFTREPMLRIFVRPVGLLLLPEVLWATLVFAAGIGSIVAISTNFATAFQQFYHFQPWQSGLCYAASIIGSIFGIYVGGWLSDAVADFLTKRNGGIREAEMRLPALIPAFFLLPACLIIYGVGIDKQLHWMVPTFGLGLQGFAVTISGSCIMTYIIDAYRPVAGEVIVSLMGFKACFAFLLAFEINPWIELEGYAGAFGEMAAICGVIILFALPFYIWGKKLRMASMKWRIAKSFSWDLDREVGE